MHRFDDATRRRLATGWDPHASTLREYAQRNGVSERALRNWRAKWAPEHDAHVPARHLDVPAGAAADVLREKLDALDAALVTARAALDAVRAGLDAATAPSVLADDAVPLEVDVELLVPGAEVPGDIAPPKRAAEVDTAPRAACSRRKGLLGDFE